jgi:hypothetical protein
VNSVEPIPVVEEMQKESIINDDDYIEKMNKYFIANRFNDRPKTTFCYENARLDQDKARSKRCL